MCLQRNYSSRPCIVVLEALVISKCSQYTVIIYLSILTSSIYRWRVPSQRQQAVSTWTQNPHRIYMTKHPLDFINSSAHPLDPPSIPRSKLIIRTDFSNSFSHFRRQDEKRTRTVYESNSRNLSWTNCSLSHRNAQTSLNQPLLNLN